MDNYAKMKKEQYKDIYNVVGAAMEVYNTLGRGMEEPIYQEALQMELDNRGIASRREVWFDMFYKGKKMKKRYKAGFVVNEVIVELKSVSVFSPEHRAQLFNYIYENNKAKKRRFDELRWQEFCSRALLVSRRNRRFHITQRVQLPRLC